VIIDGQSENRDIKFGQTYKLKDWNSSTVSADSSLPSGTFGFTNGVFAAPVVCLKVAGVQAPTPSKHLNNTNFLPD